MRLFRRVFVAACGSACSLGVFGCPPPNGGVVEDRPAPPRTLEEIVSTIEANAALLDQALWSSSVTVKARFSDDRGKDHLYNLDSNFLFQRPRNLRMDLRPGLGDQVMQIGSNGEDYWVWIEPEMNAMWWGRHRHVDKPCSGTISIRPDQLATALGLRGLPGREDGLIGPARRFGRQFDVLEYLRERPEGGYLLDRAYLVARSAPFMVKAVRFRDPLGRVSMSSLLEDYRPAWEGGPLVAHTINVIWPMDNGTFTMWIDRMRGLPAAEVSEKAFDRPAGESVPDGVEQVFQVDVDCDAPDAAGADEVGSLGVDAAAPRPRQGTHLAGWHG